MTRRELSHDRYGHPQTMKPQGQNVLFIPDMEPILDTIVLLQNTLIPVTKL